MIEWLILVLRVYPLLISFTLIITFLKMKGISKYPPALFHSQDLSLAFKIARQTKFASIFLTQEDDSDIIFSPLFNQYEQNKQTTFWGHLARINPLYNLLQTKKSIPCKFVFNQADIYISPTCYNEKEKSHDVVPTWNYVSAQFRGTITLVEDCNLRDLLEREVEQFERYVGSEWRLKDATEDYVNQITKSIFGIKIEVNSWKSHHKLSQNKPNQWQNVKKWSQFRLGQQKNIVNWMDEIK